MTLRNNDYLPWVSITYWKEDENPSLSPMYTDIIAGNKKEENLDLVRRKREKEGCRVILDDMHGSYSEYLTRGVK